MSRKLRFESSISGASGPIFGYYTVLPAERPICGCTFNIFIHEVEKYDTRYGCPLIVINHHFSFLEDICM